VHEAATGGAAGSLVAEAAATKVPSAITATLATKAAAAVILAVLETYQEHKHNQPAPPVGSTRETGHPPP
jgi:uncharacterized membrane protein YebE (DUF533 family)